MTAQSEITTADQLLQASGLGRCELILGRLVELPFDSFAHGLIVSELLLHLTGFVGQRNLGVLTGGRTGFQIARDPDTVRAPDIAFVSAERVPSEPMPGFFPGAPDLAVEVLSPSDRASEVLGKVQEWLGAGCRLVWVVDPGTHTVSVYTSPNQMVVLAASDELTGGEVLPDFRLSVDEIFGKEPVRLPKHGRGGLQPGVNPDDNARLRDLMDEGEAAQ